MMGAVKLLEVVDNLSSYDSDLTIYAVEPWTCDSEVVVSRQRGRGRRPAEAESIGAAYFIEIIIALEFLDGWRSTQSRPLSAREQCERLIHYATYDA